MKMKNQTTYKYELNNGRGIFISDGILNNNNLRLPDMLVMALIRQNCLNSKKSYTNITNRQLQENLGKSISISTIVRSIRKLERENLLFPVIINHSTYQQKPTAYLRQFPDTPSSIRLIFINKSHADYILRQKASRMKKALAKIDAKLTREIQAWSDSLHNNSHTDPRSIEDILTQPAKNDADTIIESDNSDELFT